jgi:hypothetical protein
MTCIPTRHGATVLAGVKAKPSGWPSASLDPDCGRRRSANSREQAVSRSNPTKSSLYGFRGLPQ